MASFEWLVVCPYYFIPFEIEGFGFLGHPMESHPLPCSPSADISLVGLKARMGKRHVHPTGFAGQCGRGVMGNSWKPWGHGQCLEKLKTIWKSFGGLDMHMSNMFWNAESQLPQICDVNQITAFSLKSWHWSPGPVTLCFISHCKNGSGHPCVERACQGTCEGESGRGQKGSPWDSEDWPGINQWQEETKTRHLTGTS